MNSFFDQKYKTPRWFSDKQAKRQSNDAESLSRRGFLKSAAGATAISVLPAFTLAKEHVKALSTLVKTDPWLTLDATLNHLLPKSPIPTGQDINAENINALNYLYQVMAVQPTEQAEKAFIIKGVGWLNGFANSQLKKNFVALTFAEKEQILRGISQSQAGQNWLTTLIDYIFEAMLSPPAYGGNPNGIGWQWLEHQAGFPLPEKGQRYFELPPRATVVKKQPKKVIKRSNKA